MAAILFLSRLAAEGATITASSEQTLLPATNLIGPTPSKVWRSSGLSSVYITVDFGTATAVDTLAMVAPNWTTSATWRLRGATSEANLTAAPGYDSTAVTPWPGATKPTETWLQHAPFLRLGSTQTYRWWRIDIADAGNTDGYLEAGALLIGTAVGVAYESWSGFVIDDEPNDIVADTTYGRTLVEERDSCRVFSIPMRVLAEADVFAGLGTMMRERKASKPFLVCLDPDQTTYLHLVTLYGLRRGARSTAHLVADLYGTGLKIKEHI
jgi:hypothetical protein